MNAADDPQAWIYKARQDLLCIDNNIAAAQVPWDAVAFHAQQAGEKALKAILVANKGIVPRTHDLTLLLGECRALGPPLHGLDNDCQSLSRFAVQFRYPGAPSAVGKAEATEAAAAARRIVDAVVGVI